MISKDDAIDPVGACVGLKGSRVQAVVNSSMIAMMRSASSGAMPGSRSRSSRSRSRMSLRVR
ncbi:MAG TPA: hypothetical protein VFP39_11225 [Gemmatimonadales bacterium]|nr:hypothetical protein [Gemmatimonadales bacterium]